MIKKIILSILFVLTCAFAFNVYAGNTEISTYYPSPHGEYKDVKTSGSLTIPVKTVGTDTSKVKAGEIWFETP